MPPLFTLLTDLPLFEGLASVDVARLANAFVVHTYPRGEEIPLTADGPDRSLLLVDGAVRLMRAGPDGRLLGVGLLGDGGVFGRLPFSPPVDGERAEALDDSRVVTIAVRDLERIAVAHPSVARALLSEIAARLNAANDQLAGLAFQSVPARLATVLLDLADRYGRVTPRGVRIDLRLTHGQLAELTSTTRETLTKVAGWLRAENLATLGRREIWLHDLAGIGAVAGGARQMPGRGANGAGGGSDVDLTDSMPAA
ncbi:MAG TPA: Crp/Fnr family transcriptional regulator [Solirubrobacteraceae bacterium]|nr:Crp/Fnr family transcriptional regulator [Solirubrobacteraceae bacterium]